jgi:hypothetical protein
MCNGGKYVNNNQLAIVANVNNGWRNNVSNGINVSVSMSANGSSKMSIMWLMA